MLQNADTILSNNVGIGSIAANNSLQVGNTDWKLGVELLIIYE